MQYAIKMAIFDEKKYFTDKEKLRFLELRPYYQTFFLPKKVTKLVLKIARIERLVKNAFLGGSFLPALNDLRVGTTFSFIVCKNVDDGAGKSTHFM